MLKNKKVIFLLLPLNALIWGFFIYRIYSAFNETDQPLVRSLTKLTTQKFTKDSSSYKLAFNYKDPFLKESGKESVGWGRTDQDQETGRKQASPAKKIPIEPKQLPDVKYLGLIKNNASGLSTALVSINGESRLIRQNENVNGIVFKSFNKDSLVAKCGRERLVVRK